MVQVSIADFAHQGAVSVANLFPRNDFCAFPATTPDACNDRKAQTLKHANTQTLI